MAQQQQATNDQDRPFDVVLASSSPRRQALLAEAGVKFRVIPVDIDEKLDPDQLAMPMEAVKKLAERKAGAAIQQILAERYVGRLLVVGSDTMVVLDNCIYGKPRNVEDGKRTLRALSGRTHQILTSASVWLVDAPNEEDVSIGFRTFVDPVNVTFRDITDAEIEEYLALGESYDKAGAYAIQGAGREFVTNIEGSMDSAIGLPVERLLREFPELRNA